MTDLTFTLETANAATLLGLAAASIGTKDLLDLRAVLAHPNIAGLKYGDWVYLTAFAGEHGNAELWETLWVAVPEYGGIRSVAWREAALSAVKHQDLQLFRAITSKAPPPAMKLLDWDGMWNNALFNEDLELWREILALFRAQELDPFSIETSVLLRIIGQSSNEAFRAEVLADITALPKP